MTNVYTPPSQLEEFFRQYIKLNGFIPLNKFMQIAIHYYYANCNPLGKSGDFITSPEITSIFSIAVGMWVASKIEGPISIIELGSGSGKMMLAILSYLEMIGLLEDKVKHVYIVEASDALISMQKEALKKFITKISWISDIKDIQTKGAILIANEFFDALPITQYEVQNQTLYQRAITLNDMGEFSWCLQETQSNPENNYKNGDIIEAPIAALRMLDWIVHHFCSFSMLVIDYGYITSPNCSTVQGVYKHQIANIFSNIGHTDISSLVNFGAIQNHLHNLGINSDIITQREFLLGYNVLDLPDIYHIKIDRLINNKKMGELFKVMTFCK